MAAAELTGTRSISIDAFGVPVEVRVAGDRAREVCDRLVFIDGGLIVEEGPPAEFFANARSERAREFVDKIIHH